MKSTRQSSNTGVEKVIEDLDIYVRHYHASTSSRSRAQVQASDAHNAAKRLYDQGILSSLEDAQLTRRGFEIARQIHQSLSFQAEK